MIEFLKTACEFKWAFVALRKTNCSSSVFLDLVPGPLQQLPCIKAAGAIQD